MCDKKQVCGRYYKVEGRRQTTWMSSGVIGAEDLAVFCALRASLNLRFRNTLTPISVGYVTNTLVCIARAIHTDLQNNTTHRTQLKHKYKAAPKTIHHVAFHSGLISSTVAVMYR